MSSKSNTTHKPHTFVQIHKRVLLRNYNFFAESGLDIAPVIKSNAYGHDACQVVRFLSEHTEVPFFITATYEQAVELRVAGITKPLLVIGYVSPRVIADNQQPDITFTAVDMDHLKDTEAVLTKTQPIHLKLDTGMHRYGVIPSDLKEAIAVLQSARHTVITGVFSHICDNFTSGVNDFTKEQIRLFNQSAELVTSLFPSCKTTHLASTSSHSLRAHIEANTERVGIGLYGLANFTDEFYTEPVLSLMSTIASIRKVLAGEFVGYSRTYSPQEDRLIATIPAGYYEGVDRRLSNLGVVRIGTDVCPIVGKVSMNATTIDVTDCSVRPARGDLVEIISADRHAPNSAEAITKTIDAVHYRITTQIPARLPRIMV
ncbi:MAG: alanine racemase [Candidatus Paceibacterota bacterium]